MFDGRTILVCLILLFCAATRAQRSKPTTGDSPLTTDQVAVYRAVLKDYTKGSDGSLNLANRTESLDGARPMVEEACFKEVDANLSPDSSVSHTLEPSLVADMRIVLVDSDTQQKAIDKNDPQNLVKKAVDDHERVTDEEVYQSVKHAFQTGMFTLSEIVFDKAHRRAAVAYSFVCGGLCGNGNTLILKRSGQTWKVTRRCGRWVS